jgi:hypothetical protein
MRLRYFVLALMIVIAAAATVKIYSLKRYESKILDMVGIWGVVYYGTECNSAGTPLTGQGLGAGIGGELKADIPQSMLDEVYRKLCPIIVYANLKSVNVSDESIEVLADYDYIKQLNLTHTEVTSASVEALARMRNLNKVNLLFTKFTSKDVNRLQELRPDLEIEWFEIKPSPF